MKVDRKQAAQQRRIAKALSEIGFALPGSLTVRAYRCGKANCRCKAGATAAARALRLLDPQGQRQDSDAHPLRRSARRVSAAVRQRPKAPRLSSATSRSSPCSTRRARR